MCRSIKQLRNPQQPPSHEQISAAALQYVRKISGYRKPSRRNQAAFELAVAEVTAATQRLIDQLNDPSVGMQVVFPAPTSSSEI